MLGIRVGSEELGIGAGVPSGVSAAVLIGGTNDMPINQKMGARWEVTDPDGQVVDSYEDWEMFWTGPGLEQGFVGNQFSLDKLGTYTVRAELLMNPDDPVTVDSYDGALCVVTEAPPPGELIQHTIYPYAYIYDGDVEVSTFTFTSIPFTPASWQKEVFASRLEDEVRKAGGRVLETKVYVDEHLLRPWTNWHIEITGVPPPTTGVGMALGISWWAVAILAVLAIVLVIVITWGIKTVVGLVKRKPGLHDMKPAWGKETLILTITDSEEFWERPPTPMGTLEGMSEAGLRDYLDKIAEEEVGEEVDWAALAIVGGIALLGSGVAAAFVFRKT